MSEVDLDAIEARAKAATPGPWRAFHTTNGVVHYDVEPENIAGSFKDGLVDWRGPRDVEFIAHARTDVEEMARELRELRARVDSEAARE